MSDWEDFGDDYSPEDDSRWDDVDTWPWEDIEHIFITRDDAGWDISVEINGEIFEIESGITDDEAESLIWDEIWHEALEWDVDVDKEVEYAPE